MTKLFRLLALLALLLLPVTTAAQVAHSSAMAPETLHAATPHLSTAHPTLAHRDGAQETLPSARHHAAGAAEACCEADGHVGGANCPTAITAVLNTAAPAPSTGPRASIAPPGAITMAAVVPARVLDPPRRS